MNGPSVAWLAPVGDGRVLSLHAVTSVEVKETRSIGTYAAVTAGDETVAGVSGRERVATVKGVVSNFAGSHSATAEAVSAFGEAMVGSRVMRFVSRDSVFPSALLQSFTVTSVSGGLIEVEATIRAVREIEISSTPGIKSKSAPPEAGTKQSVVAHNATKQQQASKANQKAVDEARQAKKGSMLFRGKNWVSDKMTELF